MGDDHFIHSHRVSLAIIQCQSPYQILPMIHRHSPIINPHRSAMILYDCDHSDAMIDPLYFITRLDDANEYDSVTTFIRLGQAASVDSDTSTLLRHAASGDRQPHNRSHRHHRRRLALPQSLGTTGVLMFKIQRASHTRRP